MQFRAYGDTGDTHTYRARARSHARARVRRGHTFGDMSPDLVPNAG